MMIISKNSEGNEKVYENVDYVVIVKNTGEEITLSASRFNLVYINENDVQLFAISLK